jgi:hypothetical protein
VDDGEHQTGDDDQHHPGHQHGDGHPADPRQDAKDVGWTTVEVSWPGWSR